MALTVLNVAHMALAVIDEAPFVSVDEDTKPARLFNLHYEVTRRAEFSKNEWVFAIVRTSLTGTDLGTDPGTLNWRYTLPADCTRVLPLTRDGEPDSEAISWRREGAYIYTDRETPITVRYIKDEENPALWSSNFAEVVAAAIGVKIAYAMSHKSGMIEVAQSAYQRALADARRANAFQRGNVIYSESWGYARGDQRYWRA